jgi:hypothetical protein
MVTGKMYYAPERPLLAITLLVPGAQVKEKDYVAPFYSVIRDDGIQTRREPTTSLIAGYSSLAQWCTERETMTQPVQPQGFNLSGVLPCRQVRRFDDSMPAEAAAVRIA